MLRAADYTSGCRIKRAVAVRLRGNAVRLRVEDGNRSASLLDLMLGAVAECMC